MQHSSSELAGQGDAPDYAWLDGVIDGRIASMEVVEATERRWRALGIPEASIQIEGARFSLLPSDRVIEGERFTGSTQASLVSLLEELVQEGAEAGSVESTLRCTMVSGANCTEVLFGVVGAELRALSRERPTEPKDLERRPRRESMPEAVQSLGMRRAITILALVIVAFVASAWRSGWVDRIFASEATSLTIEAGSFAGLLETTVESEWGNYRVELRRGADYPVDAEASGELKGAAADPARAMAITVLEAGDEVHVWLVDVDGEVIDQKPVETRRLAVSADEQVFVELRGSMAARGVQLSLVPDVEEE